MKLRTAKEAAEILRVTHQTLANWRFLKKGPVYKKAEGKILYDEDDLKLFLDSNRHDNSEVNQ